MKIISPRQPQTIVKNRINQEEDVYCISQDFYRNHISKLKGDIVKLEGKDKIIILNYILLNFSII